MHQYEISIIIPTYNVEEYIDECFLSIVNQTFRNFEIIVVDDGSTDNTYNILAGYKKYLPNVSLYRIENSGSPGGPRNIGIEKSKGKYIFFMDPDDTLPCNSLELLYEKIRESNSEIVMGNYTTFNKDKKWTHEIFTPYIFHNERITSFIDEPYFTLLLVSWNKLYQKDFLIKNDIKFTEKIRYGEDREFVLKAYALASKIHIIPNIIYNYRRRENDASKSSSQSIHDLNIFFQNIHTLKIAEKILNEFSNSTFFGDKYFLRIDYDFFRFVDFYILNRFDDKELLNQMCNIVKMYLEILGDWRDLNLRFLQRTKLFLLEKNRLDDLRTIILYEKSKLPYYIKIEQNVLLFNFLLKKKCNLPDEIFKCNINDLSFNIQIENLTYIDGNLKIKGWVVLNGFENKQNLIKKYLVIRRKDNEKKIFKLSDYNRKDLKWKFGKGIISYKWGGFIDEINLESLNSENNDWSQDCELYLRVQLNNFSFEKKISEIQSLPRILINEGDERQVICIRNTGENKFYIIDDNQLYDSNHALVLPREKILQRVENITFYDSVIVIKGWAFIPFINIPYKNLVSHTIILYDYEKKSEIRFEAISFKNIWPNKQFDLNPYGFNYDFSGWEVKIPYLEIPEGNYELFIEVESQGIAVRERLCFPSTNLLKSRKQIEMPCVMYNRIYFFMFCGSEHFREKITFNLHVKKLVVDSFNYNYFANFVTNKNSFWSIENEIILLKSISLSKKSLGITGIAILNNQVSPRVQKQIILKNIDLDVSKNYICNNYIFNYGDKNNYLAGWSVEIPLADLTSGRYSLGIKVIYGNNCKEYAITHFGSTLLQNYDLWNREHYAGEFKISFKLLNKTNYKDFALEIKQSLKNIPIGVIIKGYRKLFRNTKRVYSKIKGNFNKKFLIIRKIKKKADQIFGISKKWKMVKNKLKMKVYLKTYSVFKLLPIQDNKIVMATYSNILRGNLKYIYDEINSKKLKKNIITFLGNEKSLLQLLKMAYHFSTANCVLIEDYYRYLYDLKHRKETKFIQTWHASGIFKRFALLALDKKDSNSESFEKRAHAYYTHVLVSGTKMVKPYSEAFNLSTEKIIPIGIPRTDLFFDSNKKNIIIKKIYDMFPEFRDKKVILYAPTFRGGPKERKKFRNFLDVKLLSELKQDGYVLVYKTHPHVENRIHIPNQLSNFLYDLSDYPDINHLFLITDILITDYSSNIFDFALMQKPIIAYAYDIDNYMDERGFYVDYQSMFPGPIFKTTEQILNYIKNLKNLTVDHSSFIQEFLDKIDGKSTERLLNIIDNE